MLLNILKISTQSVTLAERANANVNCYCILFAQFRNFSQESNTQQSFVILQIGRIFFDVREVEDCSKLEQRLQILAAIEYRQQRATYSKQKPFIIVCKQRPFRFESCRNRESRLNNSHEDRESSVNLLLNGTVRYTALTYPTLL